LNAFDKITVIFVPYFLINYFYCFIFIIQRLYDFLGLRFPDPQRTYDDLKGRSPTQRLFMLSIPFFFVVLLILRVDLSIPIPSHVILIPVYLILCIFTLVNFLYVFERNIIHSIYAFYWFSCVVGTACFGLKADGTVSWNWFVACIPFWLSFAAIVTARILLRFTDSYRFQALRDLSPVAALVFMFVLLNCVRIEFLYNYHFVFWLPTIFLIFAIALFMRIVYYNQSFYLESWRYDKDYTFYVVQRDCEFCNQLEIQASVI